MFFDLYLGVDQTGAVKSNGLPKSLPSAAVFSSEGNWRIECFELSHFTYGAIESSLSAMGLVPNKLSVFVCVDCVFGLPIAFSKGGSPKQEMWQWMERAALSDGFGLKSGERFFSGLLAEEGFEHPHYPRRAVEERLGANSVFTNRPFQRNIQTGTYRIWKELGGEDPSTFRLFPFEPLSPKPGLLNLCEGYPSHAWRKLASSGTFKTAKEVLLDTFPDVSGLGAFDTFELDHQDAAMLALYSYQQLRQNASLLMPETLNLEGTIFGANC